MIRLQMRGNGLPSSSSAAPQVPHLGRGSEWLVTMTPSSSAAAGYPHFGQLRSSGCTRSSFSIRPMMVLMVIASFVEFEAIDPPTTTGGAELGDALLFVRSRSRHAELRANSSAPAGHRDDEPRCRPRAMIHQASGRIHHIGAMGGASKCMWVVTIRSYAGNLFQIVQHVRPTLLEALTLAVEEAEGKGWAG